eukprot:Nk52_evm2s78 gene=Nk52_evmTU2s78
MGLSTAQEDVAGEIHLYVEGVVKQISKARETKQLPDSMKKFIPEHQHVLLQKLFECFMTERLLEVYSKYVKNMVDYRLKLLVSDNQLNGQTSDTDLNFYDAVVEWATTMPENEFYSFVDKSLGYKLSPKDLSEKLAYENGQQELLNELLDMDVDQYRAAYFPKNIGVDSERGGSDFTSVVGSVHRLVDEDFCGASDELMKAWEQMTEQQSQQSNSGDLGEKIVENGDNENDDRNAPNGDGDGSRNGYDFGDIPNSIDGGNSNIPQSSNDGNISFPEPLKSATYSR